MNHGCDMEFIENAFSSANMQVLLSTKKKKKHAGTPSIVAKFCTGNALWGSADE